MVKPVAIALLMISGQAWRASTAPGPSSKAHEKTEANCDACHTPFKGLPNEKCLACHQELKKFHAAVAAQKCVACHGEHQGPTADLTKASARASFDHALAGMPLDGGHAKVACAKCHDKPIEKVSASCAGCHQDVHKGSFGGSCTSCHKAEAWKPPLHLLTEHKLSMQGGHQGQKCANCHANGENLKPVVPCSACHEQAHGGTTAACDGCHTVTAWKPAKFDHSFCTCTLPQKHQTVGCLGCHRDFDFVHSPTLCSGCHDKERKHEPLGECSLCHSAVSWKKNEFDHNKRAKMKLTGEHLKVACEQCHPVVGAAMKFRGVPLQCEGCHQAQGDKAHGNFGPCSRCHDNNGFKRSSFDHASTGFPLTGRHAKLSCKDCHEEKTKGYPKDAVLPRKVEGEPTDEATTVAKSAVADEVSREASPYRSVMRVLAWLPTNDVTLIPLAAVQHGQDAACSHCHADVHQGSTNAAGECSACHTFDAWKPSTFSVERHAATAFPLTGKHAATSCVLCHSDSKFDDAATACSGCHVDRHRGLLGDACEKCHTPAAFKPAAAFDHGITGFALIGGHAKVSCASCHEGARGKAMLASKTPAACATCHQPKHGAELGADCSTCHDPARGTFASARGMSFAHEKTGFPLERRHAVVPCGGCHKAAGPAPTARCTDCHFDPHNAQLGSGCDDCHVPDRWRLVRFDHDKTGWPLRGRHFMTPCAQCHTGQRWVGLTDDCRDCHATDAARAKAKIPGPHQFWSRECSDCHTSLWKW